MNRARVEPRRVISSSILVAAVILVIVSIILVFVGRLLSILPSDLGSDFEILITFDLIAFSLALILGGLGSGIVTLHSRYDSLLKDSLTPGTESVIQVFRRYLAVGFLLNLVFFSFSFLLPSQFWLNSAALPFTALQPIWSTLSNLVANALGPNLNLYVLIMSAPFGPAVAFLIREAKRKRTMALTHVVQLIPYVSYLSAFVWIVCLSEGHSIPPPGGPPDYFGPQFTFLLQRFVILVLPSTAFSALAVTILENR